MMAQMIAFSASNTFVSSNKSMVWHGLDLRWVYTDLLRNIFFHTKCMQIAQDILHDSLLRFVFSHHTEHLQEPHAYLRVVVRNLITDNFHEKSRFVAFEEDAFNEKLNFNTDSNFNHHSQEQWALSPEKIVDLQQRIQAIEAIINCLPPKCREVFWLFRIEGLHQAEIAAQLNISINMVERHVIRALVDIRAAREQLLG